ncbi:MAG: hypothetical protein IPM98_09265 [Lewinellaceae bacterium]|nr:hypothetical protein [Lewinellaceae bacterium]
MHHITSPAGVPLLRHAQACFRAAAVAMLCAACQKAPLPLPVFRELTMPVSDDMTSVWFADSLLGFATAGTPFQRGILLSTTDGGQNWQTDTVVNNRLECVMLDAAGRGYACGMDGLALVRWTNEPHWYPFRVDYAWNRGCFFLDEHCGVIVAGEGFQTGQARKLGPEAIWILDTLHYFPNALSAVWMSDSLTAHAAGLGWVLRSDNGGRSWERLPHTNDFFRSVHFPSPTTGYICGSSGTLLKTTDNGRTWHTIRTGGSVGRRNQPFRAVWFTSEEKGYLVGDSGLLWRTENGGADWTPLGGLPPSADAADIFVLGNKGWIAADKGRMFYFEE